MVDARTAERLRAAKEAERKAQLARRNAASALAAAKRRKAPRGQADTQANKNARAKAVREAEADVRNAEKFTAGVEAMKGNNTLKAREIEQYAAQASKTEQQKKKERQASSHAASKAAGMDSEALRNKGNKMIQDSIEAERQRLDNFTKTSETLGTDSRVTKNQVKGQAPLAQPWELGFTPETKYFGYETTGAAETERRAKVERYYKQQELNSLGLDVDLTTLDDKGVSTLYQQPLQYDTTLKPPVRSYETRVELQWSAPEQEDTSFLAPPLEAFRSGEHTQHEADEEPHLDWEGQILQTGVDHFHAMSKSDKSITQIPIYDEIYKANTIGIPKAITIFAADTKNFLTKYVEPLEYTPTPQTHEMKIDTSNAYSFLGSIANDLASRVTSQFTLGEPKRAFVNTKENLIDTAVTDPAGLPAYIEEHGYGSSFGEAVFAAVGTGAGAGGLTKTGIKQMFKEGAKKFTKDVPNIIKNPLKSKPKGGKPSTIGKTPDPRILHPPNKIYPSWNGALTKAQINKPLPGQTISYQTAKKIIDYKANVPTRLTANQKDVRIVPGTNKNVKPDADYKPSKLTHNDIFGDDTASAFTSTKVDAGRGITNADKLTKSTKKTTDELIGSSTGKVKRVDGLTNAQKSNLVKEDPFYTNAKRSNEIDYNGIFPKEQIVGEIKFSKGFIPNKQSNVDKYLKSKSKKSNLVKEDKDYIVAKRSNEIDTDGIFPAENIVGKIGFSKGFVPNKQSNVDKYLKSKSKKPKTVEEDPFYTNAKRSNEIDTDGIFPKENIVGEIKFSKDFVPNKKPRTSKKKFQLSDFSKGTRGTRGTARKWSDDLQPGEKLNPDGTITKLVSKPKSITKTKTKTLTKVKAPAITKWNKPMVDAPTPKGGSSPKLVLLQKPDTKKKQKSKQSQQSQSQSSITKTNNQTLSRPVRKSKSGSGWVVTALVQPRSKTRTSSKTTTRQPSKSNSKTTTIPISRVKQPTMTSLTPALSTKTPQKTPPKTPTIIKPPTITKAPPTTDLTRPPTRKIPPLMPPFRPNNEESKRRSRKGKRKNRVGFLGNVSESSIVGMYNRSEVTYGKKKIDKLTKEDWSLTKKKYKKKTKNPLGVKKSKSNPFW